MMGFHVNADKMKEDHRNDYAPTMTLLQNDYAPTMTLLQNDYLPTMTLLQNIKDLQVIVFLGPDSVSMTVCIARTGQLSNPYYHLVFLF